MSLDNVRLLTAENIDNIITFKHIMETTGRTIDSKLIKINSPEEIILNDCYHLEPNGYKKIIKEIERYEQAFEYEQAFDADPEDYNINPFWDGF